MQTNKLGAIVVLIFLTFATNQSAMADLASGIAELANGNNAVALKEINQEAEHGNPEAQVLLGDIYAYGLGGLKSDAAKAFFWYQKAANKGYSRGQELLGWAYLKGTGVSKDAKAAFKSFQAAANGGNQDAQYQLALMLGQGEGVSQNHVQAVKWLRVLADAHHGFALNDLGWAYQNGLGVNADKVLAFALYNTSSLFGASLRNKAGVNRAALSNEMTDMENQNGLKLACALENATSMTAQIDAYIANPKPVLDKACTF